MSAPTNKIEEILRDRIKFIGDDEHTYFGTPGDLIKAIAQLLADERERAVKDIKELETMAKEITFDRIRLATWKKAIEAVPKTDNRTPDDSEAYSSRLDGIDEARDCILKAALADGVDLNAKSE